MNDISENTPESGSTGVSTSSSEENRPSPLLTFPIRIGPDIPRVTERAGRNQAETDPETGRIRLQWLTPFALSRRGEAYELWDADLQRMTVRDEPLPLRPFVTELAEILACGEDMVFRWVHQLENYPGGPQNAKASDMLKSAQGGGEGTSRLGEAKEKALTDAVWEVRVTRGIKPGRKAMKEIRNLLAQSPAFANQKLPSPDTIAKRWNTDEIKVALADPYARDHLNRLCGDPDKILGVNSVLCIDCATMSNAENEVRALDDEGRDLGPVTVIWGLNAATRGVWTVLGFPGAQNGFLVGCALRLALIDKAPLLKEYGLEGFHWPFHGRPGEIQHDHGSEFINRHIERALRERDIAFPVVDRSPVKTPHYRGRSERFHGSAQWLFSEFLQSPHGKKITYPVKGKPGAIGIPLKKLNPALVTWVVQDWHQRPLSSLGGDSPLSRWEKFVQGKNGLPKSGVQPALEDSNALRWEFLWKEYRTVNQLGIQFQNRNYRSGDLDHFLKPNSRSSGKKEEFGFNPYHMGEIFVKVVEEEGERIVSIPWKPIDDKFRCTIDLAARSKNPTYWEWKHLYQDLVAGNTAKVTPQLMEDMQRHREEQETKGSGRRGKGRQKITGNAREAMRGFATDALPEPLPTVPSPAATEEQFVTKIEVIPPVVSRTRKLLPVGEQGQAEY